MKHFRLASEFISVLILLALVTFSLLLFFQRIGLVQILAGYFFFFLVITVFFLWFKTAESGFFKNKGSGSLSRNPRAFNFRNFNIFALLGWIGIALMVFLVFHSIFLPGSVVWRDAPYFYPDAFRAFFQEPIVWEARGRLGVVNDLYWIYPLMFVYTGLGWLGLSNDLVIRLVFYLPAIFSALLSPWFLSRYLKLSPMVGMFLVFVYGLSNYFILVIDGGQVGVALAYGLFPFALLQLIRLRDKTTFFQFYLTLVTFMLLVMADVRFAAMAVFAFFLWTILDRAVWKLNLAFWKIFGIFLFVILVLSSYWIFPSILLKPTTGGGIRSGLQLISILNPLFLFSPHWPFNEFGKVLQPAWYFSGVPFLILFSLFSKRTRQTLSLVLIFLFFVFAAKGETGFLGGLYAWAVDTMPFGGAFRDSTKFFAPLVLFAGILMGLSIQNSKEIIKSALYSKLFIGLAYFYLLFLIHPAILGNMHGVLAQRDFPVSLKIIADKISAENGFLRTVWFPERHPLGFHTEEKPALDAKSLVGLRSIAVLNMGTFDVFNFLNNSESIDWLKILGVKYLIFTGDARTANSSVEEQEDWQNLLKLAQSRKELHRVDWGIDTPVYEIEGHLPRIFGVKRAVLVVGADDIYERVAKPGFSMGEEGFVFLEDGKVDPFRLTAFPSDSVVWILNGKDEVDLTLTFLQKFFISPKDSKHMEWAVRGPGEYLQWKYELLVNSIRTREFDYKKGIAFSSRAGEKIIFELNVPKEGRFVLAIRSMSDSGKNPMKGSFNGNDFDILHSEGGKFSWFLMSDLDLTPGKHELGFENLGGFQVLNTVALIPEDQWLKASGEVRELTDRVGVIKIQDGQFDREKIATGSMPLSIAYKQKSSVEYEVTVSKEARWLVFTDSYNSGWILKGLTLEESYPFYSIVNGFSVPEAGEYKIVFKGQEVARTGLYFSAVAILLLVLVYIRYVFTRKVKG